MAAAYRLHNLSRNLRNCNKMSSSYCKGLQACLRVKPTVTPIAPNNRLVEVVEQDGHEPSLLPLFDLDPTEHDILTGTLEVHQAVAAFQ
jgi:hypothetical protein